MVLGMGRPAARKRTSASGRVHEVAMVQRCGGRMSRSCRAPGSRTTPSRSSISIRSTSRSSRSISCGSAFGSSSRIVVRLGRPCAMWTTVSGSKPCSTAHRCHTRATAGVESISTPSMSNSRALQWIATISSNLHCPGEIRLGTDSGSWVSAREKSWIGERGRIRTCDPRLKRALLYHLSYAPHQFQSNIFSSRYPEPRDRDVARAKAIHSAFMPPSNCCWAKLAFAVCTILAATLGHAGKKKQLPTVRWTAGAPGCAFERGEDGRYRWTMTANDLNITLLVDSQELTKSRRRFYHLLGVYVSVTYTGQDKFEFPADVRSDFVRHHDVLEGFMDPTELSTKLQNDVDTLVFETERQIKKNPKITEEKTARLREYEKEAAEFIEFLTTQSLEPNAVTLNPGNPEAHGWVFFATSNKWIGPWKDREDFILGVWMKDKVWQFPFSLPPTEGDLILRKPQE